MKVLLLTNIPSPYMVGYLNELGKYCKLDVVFEKEFDSTRPQNWKMLLNDNNFESHILHGKSVNKRYYKDDMDSAPDDKAISFEVFKFINRNYDFIIVANPCTPTGILAIMYMRIRRINYLLQSEGGFPGNGQGAKEKFKHWLMKKADLYFSTCELDDQYFLTYGASADRIRRYPFASMAQSDIPKKYVSQEERSCFKKKLGISYSKMILAVGRSVYVKGFDVLLNAIKDLPEDICTFFVGGKCLDEYKNIIQAGNIKNVFFVDNISQSELRNYYLAADIFVLPTRSDTWGLVINEAMSFGLPVITTNTCVAGNALIENGVNGYIVESENDVAIRDSINRLLENPTDIQNFGENNYNKIREWTFESMGKIVYEHLQLYKERQ